ncbi:MAG: 16S rRNA (guanine(527)-N(7))-methyltransferase RsmG [Thermoleophilia bacterium]
MDLAVLAERFALSAAQVTALNRYVDLLVSWRLANVTGVRDRDEIVEKLLGDSLALLDVIDELIVGEPTASAGRPVAWADLGSGAGLPGIPLAVARPAVEISLIESAGKKCAFLAAATAAAEISSRAHVVRGRSEEVTAEGEPLREHFTLVVARAVAPLGAVCELAAPLLAPGGYLVASTTSAAVRREQERGEAAGVACGLAARGYPPLTRSPLRTASAAVFEKVAPTPAWLPRRPGLARIKPLG